MMTWISWRKRLRSLWVQVHSCSRQGASVIHPDVPDVVLQPPWSGCSAGLEELLPSAAGSVALLGSGPQGEQNRT